jgi:hypothetical protein
LNRLRDDWKTSNAQARNFINQLQINRFQSTDSNDPMSKNGSIFKAEGTNGANAGQSASNTINSSNAQSDRAADSSTQQLPTGQVSIVTGSGTTQLASSVKDSQASDNQGEQNDFTQKKNEAEQHVREAKDKYFSYLNEALSFDPDSSAGNVFDTSSGSETAQTDTTTKSAVNSDPDKSVTSENQNNEVSNNNTTYDPNDIVMEKTNPNSTQYNDDITEQVMKAFERLRADAQSQKDLENDYAQLLASGDSSAA